MVDPKNDNQKDFVISNTDDDSNDTEEIDREEYYGDHTSVFQKRSFVPFVIGGFGLAVLIVFFIFLISGPDDVTDDGQLKSIEARIQQLEAKMATIGVMDQTVDRLAKQEQDLNKLVKRMDRFEKSVNAQIDQVIKELGALHQSKTQKRTSETKTPRPAAKSEEKIKLKYHRVRAGETLYGISRLYGITVEQLRSYNNIAPGAAIQPGQELKLSRNGKQ